MLLEREKVRIRRRRHWLSRFWVWCPDGPCSRAAVWLSIRPRPQVDFDKVGTGGRYRQLYHDNRTTNTRPDTYIKLETLENTMMDSPESASRSPSV